MMEYEKRKDINVGRDLKYIMSASCLTVFALVCVMFFSPLASQFHDDGASRGGESTWKIDELVVQRDFHGALTLVDSLIMVKGQDLLRFAYFDRFLPEEKRYKASLLRNEIYDLQWKRIEILRTKGDVVLLRRALKDYVSIIGYNQTDASELLKQLDVE